MTGVTSIPRVGRPLTVAVSLWTSSISTKPFQFPPGKSLVQAQGTRSPHSVPAAHVARFLSPCSQQLQTQETLLHSCSPGSSCGSPGLESDLHRPFDPEWCPACDPQLLAHLSLGIERKGNLPSWQVQEPSTGEQVPPLLQLHTDEQLGP